MESNVSLTLLNGWRVVELEGSASRRLTSRSNVTVLRTAYRPTRADANKTCVCSGVTLNSPPVKLRSRRDPPHGKLITLRGIIYKQYGSFTKWFFRRTDEYTPRTQTQEQHVAGLALYGLLAACAVTPNAIRDLPELLGAGPRARAHGAVAGDEAGRSILLARTATGGQIALI